MKRFISLAAFVVLSVALADCRRPQTVVVEHDSPPPAAAPNTVIIDRTHMHGANCGHYYYNGQWYAEPEHIHVVTVP
jgi:hypothetical protein